MLVLAKGVPLPVNNYLVNTLIIFHRDFGGELEG